MEDEIEKYLNCPRTNPDRLNFKKFFSYANGKKKAIRTAREIRFLYMVQMVGRRLYGSLMERIKQGVMQKAITYFKPKPRIKFEHNDIKKLFDSFR